MSTTKEGTPAAPSVPAQATPRLDKEALLAEFAHAWEQHRHLENIRTRYLAFSFTVALAGAALLGGIVDRIDANNVSALVLGLLISILVLTINRYVATLVNDMRNIFPHYEDVAKRIRLHLLSAETEAWLNVRNSKLVQARKSTVGKSFERIANVFAAAYSLVILLLCAKILDTYVSG